MKCIQCGTNNSRRDRSNHQGRCKNCRHSFAFEPTSNSNYKLRKVTDSFFAKAISDLSAKNTLYFTPKQLFYFLDQRLGGKPTTLSQFIRSFTFKPTSMSKSSAAAGFLTICLILSVFWGIGIALYFLCCLQAVRDSQKSAKDRRFYAKSLQVFGVLISGIGILFSLHISPLGTTTLIVFILSLAVGVLIIYYAARQLPEIARQELEEHEERERLERQDREQRQRLERQEQEERERFAKLPSHLKLAPRALVLTSTQVDNWLRRWTQINGTVAVAKLLPATPQESSTVEVNSEISVYSFDRVVVCDSAAIAQVLIANKFHFEHNSAVLSITGYPQRISRTVLEMLHRNQELKVYALHDASPHGVGLVHRLRTSPTWFQNSNVTIYDLGILPRQISNPNLFVRQSVEFANQAKQMPAEVKQSLLAYEVAWLELGYFVELESLSPQRILQVVRQGIAKSHTNNSKDSLVSVGRDDSDVYLLAFEHDG